MESIESINVQLSEQSNRISELREDNDQLKEQLINNHLISPPIPEYDYNSIANRIKPFKRELKMLTKWLTPLPIATSILIKTL